MGSGDFADDTTSSWDTRIEPNVQQDMKIAKQLQEHLSNN